MTRPEGSCGGRRPGIDRLEPRRLLSNLPQLDADRPPPLLAAEVGRRDAVRPAGAPEEDEGGPDSYADRIEDGQEDEAATQDRDETIGAQPLVAINGPMNPGAGDRLVDPRGPSQPASPATLTPDRLKLAGPIELVVALAPDVAGKPPGPRWTSAPGSGGAARGEGGTGPATDPGGDSAASTPGVGDWPPLRASDLISEGLPFDRAALDRAVARFFDGIGDLGAGITGASGPSGFIPEAAIWTAAALVAFEYGRRRLGRGDDDGNGPGGQAGAAWPGLIGVPGSPGPEPARSR